MHVECQYSPLLAMSQESVFVTHLLTVLYLTLKSVSVFRFTMVGLKELCTWFDLERGGNKEAIVPRIMEFLLKPEPSGRPLPEKSKLLVNPLSSSAVQHKGDSCHRMSKITIM